MAQSSSGFAVAIKLLDLASEPLAKINRNIRDVEKSAGAGSIATRAKMAVAQADVRAYGAEVRKLAGAMRTASGESKDKLQKQIGISDW
jgi:hypothetical protein